ncbi:MAG TPA: HD domain-containing phosphohydrolase [Longimicrobiales bacterium]|nr:HD domain-containing phosphohydrolase [Longimicrobiales bacterium]
MLVVDDDERSRRSVARALERLGHRVTAVASAEDALARLAVEEPDLILLDLYMPGMDGLETARRIRDAMRMDVPIIMITGEGSRETRLDAVAGGINDFIRKPFDLRELELRVGAQLKHKRSMDSVKARVRKLEVEASDKARELRIALGTLDEAQSRTEEAHLYAIHALMLAAEYKDTDTAAHLERISEYAVLVAEAMALPSDEISLIRQSSPMHDIGKIGVPDAILGKPGALTPEERRIMQEHTVIGARIMGASDAPVIQMGRTIARWHHEHWNGSGYPDGLQGEAIPLPARICAVADFFDALTTTRVYRPAVSPEATLEMIRARRGSHFDPAVLEAFFHRVDDVMAVFHRTRESPDARQSEVGE